MASTKRIFRSFFRLFFPTLVFIILAVMGAAIWLVYKTAEAPKAAYLVTPEKYGLLSARGAKVTEEAWNNEDNSSARGWLLRGNEGAPAVILLHRYGADRSWVLNLGVKLNEATDFTILMPDMRGHGENPAVKQSSFGGAETADVISAINYLKSLKSENDNALISKDLGVYGVEMGALAGIAASSKNAEIKALALDSIPRNSDEIIEANISKKFPFASIVTSKIAQGGTYLYFLSGGYTRQSSCESAKNVDNRRVLLLAGNDTPNLQTSTGELAGCFPKQTEVEKKTDLMSAGYNSVNSGLEQGETYDRRVIDFFKRSLSGEQVPVVK